MSGDYPQETMVARTVTYTVELNGKFFIVENVPARVCLETGEEFFAPEVVEKVQALIYGQSRPKRVIEAPVYEFAA